MMWPFKKTNELAAREYRLSDGVLATYNTKLNFWSFRHEGVEFSVSSLQLSQDVLGRARESLRLVQSLDRELHHRIEQELADSPCDKSKARVALIDLGNSETSVRFEATIRGDDTWGDLALDVVIEDGKIKDVYVGD